MGISVEQEAQQAATRFRQEHRLGAQPLGDLAALIEQTTGHDVAVLDADDGEHGLTMRDPRRGRAFIGIARSMNPMRQRSTLAHELAHIIFDDWAEDLSEQSPVEIRANAFARHLLVPVHGVAELLGDTTNVSEATLSQVVQRFLVSPAIAAIVMREAGYINSSVSKQWIRVHTPQLATRFGWSDYYASLQSDSNRLRAPQGLLARAIAGFTEGVVSAQAIATLRGMPVEQVIAELSDAGIGPRVFDATEFDLDKLPTVEVDLSGLEDEGIIS